MTDSSLTQGKLISPLIRLAMPFLAGNVFSILVLAADRIWIGYVGTESLAALGVAHSVLMICINSIMGPAIGTLAGVARSTGSGDTRAAISYFTQGVFIASCLGLFFVAAAFWLPGPVMDFMNAGPEVTNPARDYLFVSMLGLIIHAPLFVLTFAIQGAGDARTALKVQTIAPLVNAVLDPILIFGLGMGLVGAAWATVMANLVALLVGTALFRKTALWKNGGAGRLGFDYAIARKVVAVGVPGTLEQLVRTVALFLVLKILAPFGAAVLAGYTTMIMVIMVLIFPGLALGQATATLVGQNLGARKFDRIWKTIWASAGIYLGFMAIASGVIYFGAEYLVMIFDRNPEVVRQGSALLRTMILAFPGLAVAVILSKAFGGAGRTVPPMISSSVAHVLFQIIAATYWAEAYGVQGAYWAISMAFVVHGFFNLLMCFYFLRPQKLSRQTA